jgi:hypothetical protein
VADDALEPVPGWTVRTATRHERLVWIAAKPRLERMHRKWWHNLMALGRADHRLHDHTGHGSMDREVVSRSMHTAALAVDRLAGRFGADEREHLRLTGRLPEWFWPSYRTEFAALKRR